LDFELIQLFYKPFKFLIMGLNDDYDYSQDELDNHADQLNDNNDAYWQSRGEDERPEDWEDRD